MIFIMTTKFDLDEFLANYKPKKVDITKYLNTRKLRRYREMTDIYDLIPKRTYVKYIICGDAFSTKDYESHVRCGGFLINGLVFVEKSRKFSTSDDNGEWTHLLIKWEPVKQYDHNGNIYDSHYF